MENKYGRTIQTPGRILNSELVYNSVGRAAVLYGSVGVSELISGVLTSPTKTRGVYIVLFWGRRGI